MTTVDTTTQKKNSNKRPGGAAPKRARKPAVDPSGRTRSGPPGGDDEPGVNEVRLLGRVTSVPVVVDLPSGDALVSFRISVPRGRSGGRSSGAASGQRVDSIPCSAWTPALRRKVASWRAGDTVEVSGAMCCRFYQAGGATRSRVEVVVATAKVVRRSRAA